jgi:Integrase core domain
VLRQRPEFIAHAVADWCRFNGVGSLFIDPGSPWQNAWIESFNWRLRDELLNAWRFDNLLEAKVLIEDWRIDYNMKRPHSAHGDLTPSEFAQAWIYRHQSVPAQRLDHLSGPAQPEAPDLLNPVVVIMVQSAEAGWCSVDPQWPGRVPPIHSLG